MFSFIIFFRYIYVFFVICVLITFFDYSPFVRFSHSFAMHV